jgi:hypothetical protein
VNEMVNILNRKNIKEYVKSLGCKITKEELNKLNEAVIEFLDNHFIKET